MRWTGGRLGMLAHVTRQGDAERRRQSSAHAAPVAQDRRRRGLGWLLAATGAVAAAIAAIVNPGDAGSAASQVWSPFVLVGGLLLIDLVADDDELFSAAGHWLARVTHNGVVLFVGAMVLVAVVTAVLNLDTSVAFLTPVLVYTARSRGEGQAALLYGCLLLSNAASLVLPDPEPSSTIFKKPHQG